MSTSTDEIILHLRERIHRPHMYWHKPYEIERLYKEIFRRLGKVPDFESAKVVGRPCFDYLHFYMREAGLEPGLRFEIGHRGGWFNLWLHWSNDTCVCRWNSVGKSSRSYHQVKDRSEAAAELMGLKLFTPPLQRTLPLVKNRVKMAWDWELPLRPFGK